MQTDSEKIQYNKLTAFIKRINLEGIDHHEIDPALD